MPELCIWSLNRKQGGKKEGKKAERSTTPIHTALKV